MAAIVSLMCISQARPMPETPKSKWFSCTIDFRSNQHVLTVGRNESAIAYGFFDDTVEDTGGGHLFIRSNKHFTDRHQLSCAGYLEGFLTSKRITDFYRSLMEIIFPTPLLKRDIHDWLAKSMEWTLGMSLDNDTAVKKDQYWNVVGNTMVQFLALVEGYNANSDYYLSTSDLFMLNSLGDIDDLMPALNFTEVSKNSKNPTRGVEFCSAPWCIAEVEKRSHCTVLVKPIQGELYVTHNMWTGYFQMLVVWKQYDFGLSSPGVVSSTVAFSSWPGLLSSEDDFYITGQGLMIAETTNNVYDYSLYDLIHPSSLVSWIRAISANYMATDALSWHEIFKQYNSGTYNNQWVVTDSRLYKPGATVVPPNSIVVGSQLPGYYEYADVSWFLNQHGYWASYNVPYFERAFKLSGYAEMQRLYGDLFSWENTPRAKIVRQTQANITNLPSLQRFMRYNDWNHDPRSLNCPMNQIAARGDLSPEGDPMCLRGAFGAVNAKIASSARVPQFSVDLVVGPTHDSMPVFSWTPEFVSKFPVPHYGQAQVYNFTWHRLQYPVA
jgi:hypothetical protein